MEDYRTHYNVEAGDKLDVTIRTNGGDEQSGTFTAQTAQEQTTPAGRGGAFTIEDNHGREMVVTLYHMELMRDDEDAIGSVEMQSQQVAELISMEVA